MMSRAAFYTALVTDATLNSMGITEDTVFHNYSSEERPSETGPFIILRWGDQGAPLWQEVKAFEALTLWVHYPKELSNDFTKLIKILDQVDNVLIDLRDSGSPDDDWYDGYTLSFVQIGARSGDFLDEGFGTITKNAAYQVFTRRTDE